MKKFLALLMSVVTVLSMAGCGSSENQTAESSETQGNISGTGCTYDFPQTGFGFELPGDIEIKTGCILSNDVGEMNYGEGVMFGIPVYFNMTEDELNALPEEEYDKIRRGFSFEVFCVKDAGSDDEVKEKIIENLKVVYGGKLEEGDEEALETLKQIHKEGEYTWYSAIAQNTSENFEGDNIAEYNAFYDAADAILASMKFCEPYIWHGNDAGDSVVFDTVDLNGTAINSAVLFGRNKVTMVNIWSTTCGPCINEMAELQKIHEDISARGGAVVGLVVDVPVGNNMYLQDAQDIISDTGVSYINLRAWEGFTDSLSCVGTPTTYFVDSNGKILGDPILGARVSEYESRLDEYLK